MRRLLQSPLSRIDSIYEAPFPLISLVVGNSAVQQNAIYELLAGKRVKFTIACKRDKIPA